MGEGSLECLNGTGLPPRPPPRNVTTQKKTEYVEVPKGNGLNYLLD